ncbi:spore germination protein [Salicibibacter cibarius]|uniref:Spore germination protein n=1 Tax=Salicibibacter cibarius TaxID=2743000 RepID=A0A7T6Z1H4_9BACI|nr:spore germination protein [Salicibibacter cibarius]QQK75226.1 spore germination protein [Salicibibacter cibarius]
MIFMKRKFKKQKSERNLLKASLSKNIAQVKKALGNSSDVIIREVKLGEKEQINAAFIFMETLADTQLIQESILKTLMVDIGNVDLDTEATTDKDRLKVLMDSVLTVADVHVCTDFQTLYLKVLSGDTVIIVDGCEQGLIAGTKSLEGDRAVSEPTQQNVVRGPQDAFVETLKVNLSLIRKKIKSPNLRVKTKTIGVVTQTEVSVLYIHGIANDKVVQEAHERLDKIDIDAIFESGYIEELIQDEVRTPFPTIYNSERPDVIAAGLMEGRVAIVVDGTPFVLLVPALFTQFYQAAEDYYQRSDIATLLRLLRLMALFISLLGPSVYVAMSTFHIEALPHVLLVSLAAQQEGIPFPVVVEALIMETMFEMLREAGLRMPKPMGEAVSIVGALVIGLAAVEAGLVSAAMVVVVSATAIASFITPAYNMAISIRMLRFVIMAFAASFGMFGIIVCLIALGLHLCSLRSFGVPYMSPMAPYIPDDQKDSILRMPQWRMHSRPHLISQTNVIREQTPRPRSKG